MKKLLFTVFLVVCAAGVNAQTQSNRLGLTFGGGSQKYAGDLGNAFTFKNRVWRGGVTLNTSYYVNRSFDAGIYGYIGDFGFCQPHEKIDQAVGLEDRCPGCLNRIGLGNLSSRMYIAGLQFRYKLSNGYILKEENRLKPYVSFGIAVNKLQDRMKMDCVKVGNYGSVNVGAGFQYYLTGRLSIGYSVNLGSFMSDEIDFINKGAGNDLFLQQSVLCGIDLF